MKTSMLCPKCKRPRLKLLKKEGDQRTYQCRNTRCNRVFTKTVSA